MDNLKESSRKGSPSVLDLLETATLAKTKPSKPAAAEKPSRSVVGKINFPNVQGNGLKDPWSSRAIPRIPPSQSNEMVQEKALELGGLEPDFEDEDWNMWQSGELSRTSSATMEPREVLNANVCALSSSESVR